MLILGYPIVGEVEISEKVRLPLVDVPMMPDEEWKRMSEEQAIKNFTRENGNYPNSAREAFQWQREWISKMEEQ